MKKMIQSNILNIENGNLLSKQDKHVINILMTAIKEIQPKKVILRFVGGWVRDHLIGLENDDYDISVEGMGAEDFAKIIQLQFPNSQLTYLEGHPQKNLCIKIVRINIKENDKITLSLDITEINDPFEDAMQRDFTLNSVFYNINESKIEDFVNGIESIENKIIKIQTDPKIAFVDEPRRILRLFRFVSKFGFNIEDQIIEAIQLENVKKSFKEKIGNARIGQEIHKMIKGKYFNLALHFIIKTNTFQLIFDVDNIYHINEEELMNQIDYIYKEIKEPSENLVFSSIYYSLYNTKNQVTGVIRKYLLPNDLAVKSKRLQKMAFLFENDQNIIKLERIEVAKLIIDIGEEWKQSFYLIRNEEGKNKFKEFEKFVEEQNLETIYLIQPLLTPKELMDVFGIKNGKEIAKIKEDLLNWQIMNPSKTKEDFILYMKK